jgi:hypothetical protein
MLATGKTKDVEEIEEEEELFIITMKGKVKLSFQCTFIITVTSVKLRQITIGGGKLRHQLTKL